MGRRRSGARLTLALATTLAAGCVTVESEAPTSRIHVVDERPGADTSASCAQMLWPVTGPLSSPFGRRWGHGHDGIDVAVPEDTPVRAACEGTVAYAGNQLRGYGNIVILQHAGALATVYAHNRELDVHVGDRVARGQVIARSGQTGHATAPHLHFEVRKDSIARDPLGYLPPR